MSTNLQPYENEILEIIIQKNAESKGAASNNEVEKNIQNELKLKSNLEDWQIHYSTQNILKAFENLEIQKTSVENKNEITQEQADQKAQSALASSWTMVAMLLFGSFLNEGRDLFFTPIAFSIAGLLYVNMVAKKALKNNTTSPQKALKAMLIAKITLGLAIISSTLALLTQKSLLGSVFWILFY